MKVVDFIRKHGWTAVIAAVKNTTAEETVAFESKDIEFLDKENPMLGVSIKVYAIPYLDVKKYTDAYELVESIGGLEKAKEYSKAGNVFRFEEKPIVRKAIADVESCQ